MDGLSSIAPDFSPENPVHAVAKITSPNVRNEWETPPEIFARLDAEFKFRLDVAANQRNRKCEEYFGPDHGDPRRRNALVCCWAPRVCWLNPPYNNVTPWLEKANHEAKKGATVVVLVHLDPSTKWWTDWAMKATEIRILTGGRIRFIPPPGVKASSNSRPSALLIYRPKHNLAVPKTVWWEF